MKKVKARFDIGGDNLVAFLSQNLTNSAVAVITRLPNNKPPWEDVLKAEPLHTQECIGYQRGLLFVVNLLLSFFICIILFCYDKKHKKGKAKPSGKRKTKILRFIGILSTIEKVVRILKVNKRNPRRFRLK